MKGTLADQKPFLKLLTLLLFVLLGIIISTLISILFLTTNEGNYSAISLRILLILQSVGAFLFPALITQHYIWREKINFVFAPTYLDVRLVILAPLLLFAAAPILNNIMSWNQSLHLPDFMQGIENWMITSEKAANKTLAQLFTTNSASEILGNLITVGLFAAVCEEVFFRGILQRIFKEWAHNSHLAVWITAFIFSAIHMQFFGFFPRMLLGVLLGYLFVWSKNIWVPIFAHFCNNALVVLTEAMSTESTLNQTEHFSWPWILGSLLLMTLIIYGIFHFSQKLHLKIFSPKHETIT